MHDERTLKAALRELPNPGLTGYFYRAVAEAALHRFDPPQPLYALGPGTGGQRFTPPGGPPALYVAENQGTALVEHTHAITSGLRAAGLLLPAPPVVLYGIEVRLVHILDLTNRTVLEALDTDEAELKGPWAQQLKNGDLVPTHILASAAYDSHRFQAIRYPSAEVIDGVNLVVWTRKVRTPCYLEVYDPTGRLAARIPRRR